MDAQGCNETKLIIVKVIVIVIVIIIIIIMIVIAIVPVGKRDARDGTEPTLPEDCRDSSLASPLPWLRGRCSKVQVSFVIPDPGALNYCMHTFPETNAGFTMV